MHWTWPEHRARWQRRLQHGVIGALGYAQGRWHLPGADVLLYFLPRRRVDAWHRARSARTHLTHWPHPCPGRTERSLGDALSARWAISHVATMVAQPDRHPPATLRRLLRRLMETTALHPGSTRSVTWMQLTDRTRWMGRMRAPVMDLTAVSQVAEALLTDPLLYRRWRDDPVCGTWSRHMIRARPAWGTLLAARLGLQASWAPGVPVPTAGVLVWSDVQLEERRVDEEPALQGQALHALFAWPEVTEGCTEWLRRCESALGRCPLQVPPDGVAASTIEALLASPVASARLWALTTALTTPGAPTHAACRAGDEPRPAPPAIARPAAPAYSRTRT